MSPAPDERDRIRVAMDRLLNGAAENSNGALTITALAIEAGVPRNALTQRHPDLRNEFYSLVRQKDVTPHVEIQLRKTIEKLKKRIENDQAELKQLRADVPALVRCLAAATLENQKLREALQSAPANVVPLRPKDHQNS